MKVVGIIAEYNPFHKGHAYHLKKTRQQTQADYVIIAMSGNFVQRGAPALLDKYSRTQMALCCGADLVLELPVLFASSSAEYFAKGGVSLLRQTGVVTHLGFGMECNTLPLLQDIAETLLHEPTPYKNILNQNLRNGFSYPMARSNALETYFTEYTEPCQVSSSSIDPTRSSLQETLSSPNNILAIEYLKALTYYKSAIVPSPILRQGSGYHDISRDRSFCSAAAIRAFIKEYVWGRAYDNSTFQPLADKMPEEAFSILSHYPHPFLFEDDFSTPIHYKLLMESVQTLASYADSSPSLVSRMKKMAPYFVSWSSFCELLKTKNVTYTRLSRLLLHMLLNIRQDSLRTFPEPCYLRVLGFRKSSAPLLSAIKSQGSLPLLVNLARDSKGMPPAALQLLSYDLDASSLYQMTQNTKSHPPARPLSIVSDYRHPVLCL